MEEVLVTPPAERLSGKINRELFLYATLPESARMEEAFAAMYFDTIDARIIANPQLGIEEVAEFADSFDRSVQRAAVANQILRRQQPLLYEELAVLQGIESQAVQSTLALFLSKVPDYRLGFESSDGESFKNNCLATVGHLRYWQYYDATQIKKSEMLAFDLLGKTRRIARQILSDCGTPSNPAFLNANIADYLEVALGIKLEADKQNIEDPRVFVVAIKAAFENFEDDPEFVDVNELRTLLQGL